MRGYIGGCDQEQGVIKSSFCQCLIASGLFMQVVSALAKLEDTGRDIEAMSEQIAESETVLSDWQRGTNPSRFNLLTEWISFSNIRFHLFTQQKCLDFCTRNCLLVVSTRFAWTSY